MASPICPSCPSFFPNASLVTTIVNSDLPKGVSKGVSIESRIQIVVKYQFFNPFGAAEWKRYFNMDVGPETPFKEGFNEWWNGPDPIDVYENRPNPRPVWSTHLRPIFIPKFLTDAQNKTHEISLYTLSLLGLGFKKDSQALQQNINKSVNNAYWLVMRKDVLARGQKWEEQRKLLKDVKALTKTNYEEPALLDLTTAIFLSKVADKVCYLGNHTGVEGRRTFSRCAEKVKYPGILYQPPVVVGSFSPEGLRILDCCYEGHSYMGIAALTKW